MLHPKFSYCFATETFHTMQSNQTNAWLLTGFRPPIYHSRERKQFNASSVASSNLMLEDNF